MYKIFAGANGYYIAWEREDGGHYQPPDNGSAIGWDKPTAVRQLRIYQRDQPRSRQERRKTLPRP